MASDADMSWRNIGHVNSLPKRPCHHIFAEKGRDHDIALFKLKDGTYSALKAWCLHEGGPLFDGDIEDMKGGEHIVCPWHGYTFNLKSGKTAEGEQQSMFETKVEDEQILVLYHCELALKPYPKD